MKQLDSAKFVANHWNLLLKCLKKDEHSILQYIVLKLFTLLFYFCVNITGNSFLKISSPLFLLIANNSFKFCLGAYTVVLGTTVDRNVGFDIFFYTANGPGFSNGLSS